MKILYLYRLINLEKKKPLYIKIINRYLFIKTWIYYIFVDSLLIIYKINYSIPIINFILKNI